MPTTGLPLATRADGREGGAIGRMFAQAVSPFALGMITILAVALAARLYQLGGKPYWLDEVFTALRSARAIPDLITDSLQNRHLPTFFLIEHAVLALGGGSAMLRLIPAIAGAAGASLAFCIAWTLGGRAAAWLAGLLLALAPMQVAFGQEARSYTLMMALILLALFGLALLAMQPDDSARPLHLPSAPRGAWAAYGFGTLGALLVLGDALPWLLAANLAMAAAILPRTNSRRGLLRNWLLVHGLILLLAAPAYAWMLITVHHQVLETFLWIPPLSLATAWMDAASLYGLRDATMVTMQLLPSPLGGLAGVAGALAVLGVWRLRDRPAPLIVLALALLSLPATLALISLIHPVLLPRYLLWSAGPFFVLAGFGIEVFPRSLAKAGVLALAALLVANLLPYYGAETKPHWDSATRLLAERFEPGDLLLVSDGSTGVMLDFNRQGRDRPTDRPHPPWPTTQDQSRAAAALAAGHRVFAVYGPAGQGRQPAPTQFFATAAKLGHVGPSLSAGAEIVIRAIDPPRPGPAVAGPAAPPRG
ncbi:MAG: hypothetical protein ACREFS_01145 [Acetobacteraceae bacterium]